MIIARTDRAERTELAENKLRGENPGFVYYIHIDPYIKIGYAKNVRTRMRAYPPNAELLAVEPGSLTIERERHKHFDADRQAGREWFRRSDALNLHIAQLVEQHGDPARYAHRYTTR